MLFALRMMNGFNPTRCSVDDGTEGDSGGGQAPDPAAAGRLEAIKALRAEKQELAATLEAIQESVQAVLEGGVCWPSGLDDPKGMTSEQQQISTRVASLTPQQFRVLTMVCDGLLNKQIAYELSVSEATIKAHVTAIFRKLEVRTRTQAALALQQMELSKIG